MFVFTNSVKDNSEFNLVSRGAGSWLNLSDDDVRVSGLASFSLEQVVESLAARLGDSVFPGSSSLDLGWLWDGWVVARIEFDVSLEVDVESESGSVVSSGRGKGEVSEKNGVSDVLQDFLSSVLVEEFSGAGWCWSFPEESLIIWFENISDGESDSSTNSSDLSSEDGILVVWVVDASDSHNRLNCGFDQVTLELWLGKLSNLELIFPQKFSGREW